MSSNSSVVYRKICPLCNNPLDIPIWKFCNDCGKVLQAERIRKINLKNTIERRKKKKLDRKKKK